MVLRRLLPVLLFSTAAWSAPTDCIREGGQMLCAEPLLKSQRIYACSETGAYLWISNLENACGFGTIASQGDLISKIACFFDAATGCPGGTSPEFNGWSQPGQSYSSWNCWNINTRQRNGYVLDQFSVLSRSTTRKDPMGNCTLSGQGFNFSYVAWLQRDVSCEAGWSTATLPNGDYRCYRCPDNSTWNGANCVCSAGFVKDPRSMQCIPVQCRADADCDDGDYCTGTETCTLGLCARVPRNCDDRLSCTVDRCNATQNACTNVIDPLLCSCKSAPALPDVTFSLGGDRPIGLSASCPAIGGTMGVTLDWKASGSKQLARCDNGCESKFNAEGELSVTASQCTKSQMGKGSLKVDLTDKACMTCGGDCELTCGANACSSTKVSGSATVTVGDFVGVYKELGWGKSTGPILSNLGAFGLSLKCGGQLTGSVSPTLGYEKDTTASNCTTCPPECRKVKASLSSSADAKLGCAVSIIGKGSTKGSGAEGAAYVNIKATGEYEDTAGACGATSCSSIRGDVEVGYKARANFKLKWFSVDGECSGKLSACSEARTCGAFSCKDGLDASNDAFSCKVTTGGAL